MIIILSYSHIHRNLSKDIGNLPAMLLPVGNRKLLEHQVDGFRKSFDSEAIVVVLPTGYCPSPSEQATLDGLSIEVQFADVDTQICDILAKLLLDLPDNFNEPIRFQLGNTWLYDIPVDNNCLAVADNTACLQSIDNSNSSYLFSDSNAFNGYTSFFDDFAKTWIGYVSFASASKLASALRKVNANAPFSGVTKPIKSPSNNSVNHCLIYQYFASLVTQYQQNHDALTQVTISDWHDCNCKDGYFIARASLTTQRSFNTLFIHEGIVTKSSHDDQKIKAEAHWYTHMPEELSPYLPKFIASGIKDYDSDSDSNDNDSRDNDPKNCHYYSLEYLPFFPLNELYVHGQSTHDLWQRVFTGVKDIFAINADKRHLNDICMNRLAQYSSYLYQQKTLSRLKKYANAAKANLQQHIYYEGCDLGSIDHITRHCIELASSLPFVPAIMHGDLCFSNLLFDSQTDKLKMIDPRGIDADGNMSIYGNQTYDLAKLAHSVIGMYDFIIAGQYTLTETKTLQGLEQTLHFYKEIRHEQIQAAFFDTRFIAGFATRDIMPAVVLLFLSMLPLHADRPDRQQAMLINAFRLYKTFVLTETNAVNIDKVSQCEATQQRLSQGEYSDTQPLAS